MDLQRTHETSRNTAHAQRNDIEHANSYHELTKTTHRKSSKLRAQRLPQRNGDEPTNATQTRVNPPEPFATRSRKKSSPAKGSPWALFPDSTVSPSPHLDASRTRTKTIHAEHAPRATLHAAGCAAQVALRALLRASGSAHVALPKFLYARCSAQVALCKLLCASCSAQVAPRKLVCAGCSAQVALRTLLRASCSAHVALSKLLCASFSVQVALRQTSLR